LRGYFPKIAKWIKETCAKGINYQSTYEVVMKLADGRSMGTFSESEEYHPSYATIRLKKI
jgi:hypothetical protein